MWQSVHYHRKLWEFCFICQALSERGMLAPGRRGLGFAVGREPLASLFASFGCQVVATDLAVADAGAATWSKTNQHAGRTEDLYHPEQCDRATFDANVSFRPADMSAIPDDLRGFDFCWSSCSFEHLGSIANGKAFLHNVMRCLAPGGVAVHTTEYNVSSNRRTLDNHPSTVIFRRSDLESAVAALATVGHTVAPFDFDPGDGEYDNYVDRPPYFSRQPVVHLKLQLEGYVCTSVGVIIHAGTTDPASVPPIRSVPLPRWRKYIGYGKTLWNRCFERPVLYPT